MRSKVNIEVLVPYSMIPQNMKKDLEVQAFNIFVRSPQSTKDLVEYTELMLELADL